MLFEAPQISLQLERYPEPEVNLQPWSAADSYLLEWLAEHRTTGRGSVCVVNDSFGALALGLVGSGETSVDSWSDSFVAHQGAKANAVRNRIGIETIGWTQSTQRPVVCSPHTTFGLVVLRVPKSLKYLQRQLEVLAPLIGPETTVVAGGMTKHVHTSTIKCFEDRIGPTTTSLARKKARLIFSQPDVDGNAQSDRELKMFNTSTGLTVLADPVLFSPTKVDPASLLLLDAVRPLVRPANIADVVDLGCGTGVIGLSLLQENPALAMTFTDESYLAVATSKASLELNVEKSMITADHRRQRFVVDDCGSTLDDASADLVCINPPFHDATAQTMAIAKRMFANAARMLRPGGSVVVVGNRHLNHHTTLRRWFAKPAVMASNRRFVVLQAQLR